MARSVVLSGAVRCPRCQHLPRWCICAYADLVNMPLKVDVLMHDREAMRPSSTGHLIKRVVADTDIHVYRPERVMKCEEVQKAPRTLWILHPFGEPLPADPGPVENLQVLLIDGSWRQATQMMRSVEGWGRKVSLPMSGESRYWLRAQQGDGQFSTIEALLFLMKALGLNEEHRRLQRQLEFHVYAGLLTRGMRGIPEKFLESSAFREELVNLV